MVARSAASTGGSTPSTSTMSGGKPRPKTGSSHHRLACPSARTAASASSALSLAGSMGLRLSTIPACGASVASARIACIPSPCARSRWALAGTAALMSVPPGAMTASRCPSHAEHNGSLKVVQCCTRSPRAFTTTDT